MVKQHVCVLIQNFLWLSADIDIDHAGIFYMYQDGVFHGCTRLTYEALPIHYSEMLQEYGSIEVPQPQSSIVNRSQLHASSEIGGEQSTDKMSNSVVSSNSRNVLPIQNVSQDSNTNTSNEKEGERKTDDAVQPSAQGNADNEVHQSTPVVQSRKSDAEPFAQYSRDEVLSPIRKQQDQGTAQQSVFPTRAEDYNQQMNVTSDSANQPGPITRIIQAQEPIAVECFCYGCKKCGQTFQSEQGYYNHMFGSHRIRNPNLHPPIITKRFDKVNTSTDKTIPSGIDNSMECGYCSKEYLSYTSLKYHIGVHHESMPAYFCPSCDKVFYVDSQLDAHYASVHENEFNTHLKEKEERHNAQERIRSRMNRSSTGEEPKFPCAFCDTVMYTRGGMEVHQLNCSSNPDNENFTLFTKKQDLTVTADSVKAWRNASAEQKTDDEKASTSQMSKGGKKKPRTIRHSGLYKSDRKKTAPVNATNDEGSTAVQKSKRQEGDTAHHNTSSTQDSTLGSSDSVDSPDVIVKSPSALPRQDVASKKPKGSVEFQMAQYWSRQAMDPRYKKKKSLYLRRSKKFFEIYYAEQKKQKLQEQATDESTLSVNISSEEQKAAEDKMKETKKRKKVTFSEESDDIPSIEYTVPARRSQRKRQSSSSDLDKNSAKDASKEDVEHTSTKRSRRTSSQSNGKEDNIATENENPNKKRKTEESNEDEMKQKTDNKSPNKSQKGSTVKKNENKGKHDRSFLTKDPRCKHDENLLRKKKYRLRSEQKVVKHSDGDNSKDQDWEPESEKIDVRVTRQTDRKKREKEQEQATDISIVRSTRLADKKKKMASSSEPQSISSDVTSGTKKNDDGSATKKVDSQGKKRKRTEDESSDDMSYPCEKCGESFTEHNEYKQHKAMCFKRPRKFICPHKKCRKPFNQKIMMNQHYKYHHTNEPKDFVCKKCDTDFVYKKSLRIHIIRLHTEDKDKAFICEICGKVFAQKWEYSAHRKDTHATVRAYTCGICKKSSFTTASRLEGHVKNCGKVPDIECGQCGKKFLTEANLITHVNDTHRKNLIWQCFVCSKTYQTEGGFYNHLRKKHGISRAKNNTLKMQKRSEPPIKMEFTVDPNEEEDDDTDDDDNTGEENKNKKQDGKKTSDNSPTRRSPRNRKPSATVSKPPDSSE